MGALILASTLSHGQNAGVLFADEPPLLFMQSGVNQTTTYRVCAAADSAFPCTSLNIFSDRALSALVTQPVTLGPNNPSSWNFFSIPGTYIRQWTSNISGTTQSFNETISVGGANIGTVGTYQGTTSVPITTTNFTALIAAAADIPVSAGGLNVVGKKLRVHGSGVYTTGAASLLNARVDLCTVSGCASGTDFAAAGCAVVTTNQANVLANGQFSIDCTLTDATTGASATAMAKALVCAQLGSATSAVQSCFQDTATALSAAVDLTVREFVNISFKFSTSNPGNAAVLHEMTVEVLN